MNGLPCKQKELTSLPWVVSPYHGFYFLHFLGDYDMDEPTTTSTELLERLSRIETMLEIINKQLDSSQPRINSLERELERQKDSLKQAHHRIDAQDKRYYWIMGILITIVTSLFIKFAG